MAKKGRINLIEEFKNQKNNDYIILTTYTFDPIFFDNYIVKELLHFNPNAEIVVLVDATQYEKSYENFTSDTGLKYHLIPIYTKKGVFHPKIFLFVSELNITYYIGSGNLTLQGFTKNAELISKTQYDIENAFSDIEDIKELLKILNNDFIHGKKVKKIINDDILSYLPNNCLHNDDFKILHNLKESIINQIFFELKNINFDEIVVLAPFLSKNPLVLKKLFENLKFNNITILLPEKMHNLRHPNIYQDFADLNDINLIFKKANFKEKGRNFHSKILWFKGETNYLLVGSPNFTISALLNSAEKGNIEFSVLFREINPQSIFNEIKTQKIENLSEIQAVDGDSDFGIHNSIKIFSAEFDDITKKLVIKTEKTDGKAIILIYLANSIEIEHILDMKEGHGSISIPESHPLEIKVVYGDQESKRRIFYDANSLFKKIRKMGAVQPKELDTKLFHNPFIEITDILSIIDGISRQGLVGDANFQSAEKNNKSNNDLKQVSPSSVSRKSATNIIRDLNRIHRFMLHKKRNQIYGDGIQEKELKNMGSVTLNLMNGNKIPKKLIRIVELANEILLNYIIKNEFETEESRLIRSQSILINLFLPVCIGYMGNEISATNMNTYDFFETFESIIGKNLIDVDKNNCSEDALVMFFSRLITLSYFFKNTDYYEFVSYIFSYPYLLDKKNYNDIKGYVFKTFDSLDLIFNIDEFNEYYSILLDNTLDSTTCTDCLIQILDLLSVVTGEFKNMLLKSTSKIGGFDDNYYCRFKIEEELLKEAKFIVNQLNNN